ncbi:MAG: prolipoprotein diacylglyceryl transferase [Gaiellaceae bacterium]
MAALTAFIPSPHSGVVHLGPLTIHMYGLMLLLGILGAVWLTGIRWVRWGGDWDLILRMAVWGVTFGIVGARLYHDVTSWNEVPSTWWGPFAVWKGGLGVWGGILFGVLAGAVVVRRSGNSARLMMDAAAPGLLLAQGIGRWGNWWNQELFGKPSTLPWALKISPEHRPANHLDQATYHPTFLYEFVWDVAMVGVLLWVDGRFRIRRPALFALYVSLYTAFRTFEETLRIDPSRHMAGLRLNFFVSVGLFAGSTAFFIWWQFLRAPSEAQRDRPRAVPTGPAMAVPKGRVRPGR